MSAANTKAEAPRPTGRWFRLNTTWSQSEWIAEMKPAARLAWIELLGYAKAHGFDGRCRAVTPIVFGRMFGVPTTDVSAMLEAAHADGALATDGHDWLITGWKRHQGDPTAASRMRRHRNRKSDGGAEPDDRNDRNDRNVTAVARNDRNVTPTETETETETDGSDTPDGVSALSAPKERSLPARQDNGDRRRTEGITANGLLAAWIDLQPARPPDTVVAKQGAAAARLVKLPAQDLLRAFVGIAQLFPHSDGEPWDLFDLEKKFAKAMAAAEKHPDAKRRKRVASLLAGLAGG